MTPRVGHTWGEHNKMRGSQVQESVVGRRVPPEIQRVTGSEDKHFPDMLDCGSKFHLFNLRVRVWVRVAEMVAV